MSDDRDVAAIAALLADDCARTILVETAAEPMSAAALSERCDVSPPTVYRRLDELEARGLIDDELRLDEEGHHYEVYMATLDHLTVDLTADGFDLRLTRRDRMADRFTRFIEDMRGQ